MQPEAPPSAAAEDECELLPEPGDVPGEITVATLDPLAVGHAPWPQNDGERLVFRHLYETLLRVDCRGSVYPGLAESWSSARDGRVWMFTLRDGASFWDGVSVTAADVVAAWTGGAAEKLAFAAGIDSIVVEGPRRLAVFLDRSHGDVPRMFADPEFAVARIVDTSPWPQGSVPEGIDGEFRLRPPSAEWPIIQFRQFPGADARDVLRGGHDVLITGDQSALDYAAPQPSYVSVPLPWDRSYVLFSTTRVRELRTGGEPDVLPADLLEALARDAVRNDARGHESPTWWNDLAACGGLSPSSEGLPRIPPGAYRTSGPKRIVYPEADPVARDLADRVVALASEGGVGSEEAVSLTAAIPGLVGVEDSQLLAAGLSGEELEASLRYGEEFAYIVPLPRIVLDPCFAARKLAGRVEWLAPHLLELTASLVPLVDTRRHLVAASERVGLYLDWDGTVLITSRHAPGGSRR
ncbi:MAG: hypothetical protein JSW46_07915 [Gemmatimonadota bacterium]|nr:MAG: hypothetical protein JSW46_07915 [Gemmatimonadota bacterium]